MAKYLKSITWIQHQGIGCPSEHGKRSPSSPPSKQKTDLHKVLTTATNFIKSPADVETHRKVDLKDAQIKEETKGKFHDLCNQFDSIISKSSGDIGKTLLIEMDIDTGNSPPPSRPDHIPSH